jgi:hypothetical protein
MLDELTEVLYRYPEDCRACGAALFSGAGFAVIAGLYVKLGTTAASMVASMAGQPTVSQASDVLPGMWTWWIPESPVGLVLYGALAAAGFALARAARKVQKQLRSM